MVRLFTLGSVALFDREGTHLSCEATQSKRLALLAYLATNSCLHRRDKLVGLFWPDSDHAHARASLNRSLHYLRNLVGEDAIESVGRESVRLDPEKVHVDAWYFRRAVESDDLGTALELYQGDYLDGLFLKGLEEFEEWVDGERRELLSMAEAAASRATDMALAKGHSDEAVTWARRALELAPHDGTAAGRLIEAMAESGDRAGALRVFAQFEANLAREFGIEPADELRALVRRIREPGFTGHTTSLVDGHYGSGSHPHPSASAPVEGHHADHPETPDPGPGQPRAPPAGSGGSGRPRLGRALLAARVLVVASGLSGVVWVATTLGSNTAGLPRFVVVTPFENRTGDPSLDHLATSLATHVTRRIGTSAATDAVAQEWTQGFDTADRSRNDRGRVAAEATGAALAVTGEIQARGDSVVVHTEITDARAKSSPHALEPVGAPRSDALGVMEGVADRVSAAVAGHLDLGHEFSLYRPPSSMESYREFRRGVALGRAGSVDQAIAHLTRAVEIDPAFVRPLLSAAHAYRHAGRWVEAARVLDGVEQRRGSLRPVEVLELDFQLAATGVDAERTVAEMRRLIEAAPLTWAYEAGLWELRVNRPEAALQHFERPTLAPAGAPAPLPAEHWARWSDALHRLGRDGEALDVARDGRKRHPESELLLEREIAALVGLGRVDEVNRQAWKSAVHREGLCVWRTALELWAHGYDEAAAEAARSTVRLNTDPFVAARATLHFEGKAERATAMIQELLQSHPDNLDYLGLSGVLAARRGDLPTIIQVDFLLETWDDPHVRGQNTYWRAKIAAARGERVSAVRLLSQAVAEGMYSSRELHRDVGLAPLRGYPPFEAFMAR